MSPLDDKQEEIEELRYHIAKVAPMIEKDYAELNEDTPFPIRFAATWSKWTLDHKREKLRKLEEEEEHASTSHCDDRL